jgi:uncharacterized protein DUF5658
VINCFLVIRITIWSSEAEHRMAYLHLTGAEPAVRLALFSSMTTTIRTKWCAAIRGRLEWSLLLSFFVALQLADVISTNYALALPGNWEANPLMLVSQAHLGALWWVPKLSAVGVVCLLAPLTRRRWPMFLAVCFCTANVWGNLMAL